MTESKEYRTLLFEDVAEWNAFELDPNYVLYLILSGKYDLSDAREDVILFRDNNKRKQNDE